MQALGRLLRPSVARLLHDEISPLMRPQSSSSPSSSSSSPASSSSSTSSSSSSSPLLPMLKEKKNEKEEPSSTDGGSPLMDGGDDGGSSFVVRNATTNRQQRRRRVGNGVKVSFGPHLPGVPPLRQQSFTQEMGHAAAETYLITRLSFKLLRYLGVGSRWITKFLALGCYALLLMPGFLQVGYFYYLSRQVRQSIVYGDEARNRLDLYLPFNLDVPKPVVAFVTGGAWIIGYKAWGALLGQHLSERDVIVACLDYRNFPQGTISDMVKDVSQGISFVCNNIAAYGGDPNKIYVIGQSAGAHIAACALVDEAMKECGEAEHSSWSISQVKAYLGISGGYNLLSLVDHFHKRGLYQSIFLSIMEGPNSLERFSPEMVVQDPTNRSAVSLLPPFFLFHGTTDFSIPSDASESFANVLKRAGGQAELILYEGKTHTDLFLQDPFRGGTDELLRDILAVIHAGDAAAQAADAVAPPTRRLVPEFMLKLAHKISPF